MESRQANGTQETEVKSQEAASDRGERFNTLLGIMIAVVTVVGALVAWRSALAATEAGNEDDAGIIAALNVQETGTIGDIISNQNRTNHLSYWANRQVIEQMAADGSLDNTPPDKLDTVVREITEASDLATANKKFFPSRYLNPDDTYNATRESAENLAEAAEKKDLNDQAHFDAANVWRDRSLALVAALVVLGISLWLFAAAETIDHKVQYALALGGLGFLLLGAASALAIETGFAGLADVSTFMLYASFVLGGLLVLGAIAMLIIRGKAGAKGEQREDDETPGERRFKQLATLLIATLALLGAVAAYLQADAGNRGDTAIRRAQLLAAESLGVQSSGEAQVNFQYGGAAQTWEELKVRANAAIDSGDSKAAARYEAIQQGVAGMSTLLKAPYFDPATGNDPDITAFQADRYVAKAATLSEASALGGNTENAWEAKSNAYVIHLTLLATALALLGLALTLGGRVRPLFLGVSSLITVVTLGWMVATFVQPVQEIPQAAVEAYGRGVGAVYKDNQQGAVAAFDEAIAKAPQYANALYWRAGAKASLGDLEASIVDYKAAQAAGKDDATVAWELGLSYYLQGQFDEALASFRTALDRDPKRITVKLATAIALLAAGKSDEARAEYKKAMDELAEQVAEARAAGKEPPPSLWYYLDAGADDLEGLFYQINDQPRSWTSAPPKDKIKGTDAVLAAAEDQFNELKNLAVALEYTGKPVTGTLEADIEPFQFGVPTDGDNYDVKETFPSESNDIYTLYKFDGMQDGQQVIWKVFVDGVEYPEYRTVTTWDKGASGETARALTDDFAFSSTYSFDPGEYTVEMYVNSHLAQRGYFMIDAPVDVSSK